MNSYINNFFGRVTPRWQGLSEKDQGAVARQSLLSAGLAMLRPTGGNFGAALANGIQGGLLSANQGVSDAENARYKDDILARTRQGMLRNAAIEEAQRGVLNPDGSLNEGSWSQWASVDPVGAQEFRQKVSPKAKWEPGQIGYRDPETGKEGLLDVIRNTETQEYRDLQGNIISEGLLGSGAAAPQLPSAGLLSPAAARLQLPSGGLLGSDLIPGLEQAVMQVESGGDPAAVSSKGAVGTMQTMPGTLRDPGYGVVPARDQSAAEQERVGKDYLQAMLRQYADPRAALAAYNWGPGNVDSALRAAGGNVDAMLASAPAETRAYVPKVLAQAGQARPTRTAGLEVGFRPDRSARQAERQAPSGYRFSADGSQLEAIPGGPADRKNNPAPGDLAQAEQALRKEFIAQIKVPQTVVNSYEQIAQAAKNPSAQNDLALIFSYMRMLDPTSVVREGEFANAQNAAGVPDRIRNEYNRLRDGQRLNPEQRTGFVNSAKGLHDQAKSQIDAYREQYSGLAREYNYAPERVVGRSTASGGAAARGASVVPPAAVNFLRKNPSMRAAFEQKYGVSADDYLR
ncbi:transglycosylase SLT domain-containing protein [Stenotrophomonas maltophilia]|uniref:lytic transglycosylase domain-containing protein n=1 Tax=Stenotrophomonas maltophilia TaxID=40324 RepID=UPI0021C77897|nr:transglycosylase SLT domain-containing protein [Stenotrophomonas maltophilia]MCU1157518.1 transglycosylase SLT domain-containing protein [Stenotrophomonas maltophilia]